MNDQKQSAVGNGGGSGGGVDDVIEISVIRSADGKTCKVCHHTIIYYNIHVCARALGSVLR